jgi:DNA-directed RNA polymerase specialized sigma24 family protein
MKNLEENKILEKIQKGENTSENFKKILDLHSNIFYKICNKYMYTSYNFHKQDFLMDKNYFIYQCILDYKFDKGAKFSTYLASRVKWFCLNFSRKYKRDFSQVLNVDRECMESLSDGSDEFIENNCETSEHKDIISSFIQKLKSHKDKRLYRIFHLRYIQGKNNSVMPWSEVSKDPDINLSIQGCINVHDKYLKTMRKEK